MTKRISMIQTKILLTNVLIATGILLTACTSSGVSLENVYIYNDINFGSDRNSDFQHGVRDACRTADGDYTKNHNLFKTNESYRIGWEDGRLQCKGK